jgi:CPA2 family monovalent cation:H+ antiporter-2
MESLNTHTHLFHLLGDILLILGLSGIIIPALQKFKISPVLGYLLCGLLLGPHAAGLFVHDYPLLSAITITDSELVTILAELGIVFLLFMIGLELTISRLWDLRKYVLGLGSAQILITALIIFLIALSFDNPLPISILIGAAFALSSTAIIMQLLNEWHMISLPVGRIVFSILLMQDLAVVPILVMISALSGSSGDSTLILLFQSLLTALIVIIAIFIFGKTLLRPTLKALSPNQNAEWLFATILFLVIGCAALTQAFGLSAALGAFLAGLLIAETEYRHEVEAIIDPLKGVLMGIFFMSVGMATDISAVLDYPFWLFASIIGIFIIKASSLFPIALLFGVSKRTALHTSLLLAQCGEFAFLVIGLSLSAGLLPENHAQFFLLVASVSLLLTPITTRLAPLADKIFFSGSEQINHIQDFQLDEQNKSHIIIAGFGRVGQTLAKLLEEEELRYIAIDKDSNNVHRLHDYGYPVIVGNATHIDLWKKLNIQNAKAAVITIDDFSVTGNIIRSLRHHWPLIPIIVRVRDTSKLEQYYEAGASIVVPETLESTLQLARTLLSELGIPEEESVDLINKYRQEILSSEYKIKS